MVDKTTIYPNYRWVIAILICLASALRIYLMVMTAPLMTIIMQDLNVGLAAGGMTMSIVALTLGLSMFGGTFLVDRFGIKKSMTIALLALVLGSGMAFSAQSIVALLVGRAIVGIGVGLAGLVVSPLIMTWFPPSERPLMISANMVSSVLLSFLSFVITIPLYNALGSWQYVMGVMAVISVAMLAGWVAFGKENTSYAQMVDTLIQDKMVVNKSIQHTSRNSALLQALKRKDIWILTLYMSLLLFTGNTLITYLPTFLQVFRGMEPVAASNLTGILPLTGIVGTIIGGILASLIGRRRPILIPVAMLMTAFSASIMFAQSPALLIVLIGIFGMLNTFGVPSAQVIITEVKGVTQSLSAGGHAMMFGFGNILSFFAPAIFGSATDALGMQGAMLVICIPLVLGILVAFFIEETGPKRYQEIQDWL